MNYPEEDQALKNHCMENLSRINSLLKPVFRTKVYESVRRDFGFSKIQKEIIFNRFEGQLDPGRMMTTLMKMIQAKGIRIINNIEVEEISGNSGGVKLWASGMEFSAGKVFIATNGFSGQFGISGLRPARAQVLITQPLEHLPFRGTFLGPGLLLLSKCRESGPDRRRSES